MLRVREFLPGILISVVIAGFAMFVTAWLGGPVIVVALLVGFLCHPWMQSQLLYKAGIDWSASMILRIAVALLGFRITFADLGALGWSSTVALVGVVCAVILSGVVLARVTGRPWQLGVLTGGAVGICGASAAIAIGSVLPGVANRERTILLAVIGVTGLSTLAMLVYPWLFLSLGWPDATIGFALGASIHDVAQVVGAGYAVSPDAGDVAVLTKMQRVMLLPVLLVILLVTVGRAASGVRIGLPWFVIAFALGVVLNSVIPLPAMLVRLLSSVSQWCLIIAIAALGLKTSMTTLIRSGGVVMTMLLIETLLMVGLVVVVAYGL
jgi:uncharacterized integral membrane protein (TIGR00698 family)